MRCSVDNRRCGIEFAHDTLRVSMCWQGAEYVLARCGEELPLCLCQKFQTYLLNEGLQGHRWLFMSCFIIQTSKYLVTKYRRAPCACCCTPRRCTQVSTQ